MGFGFERQVDLLPGLVGTVIDEMQLGEDDSRPGEMWIRHQRLRSVFLRLLVLGGGEVDAGQTQQGSGV